MDLDQSLELLYSVGTSVDSKTVLEEISKLLPSLSSQEQEKVRKIVEDLGVLSGMKNSTEKTASGLDSIKREISTLSKPTAIALTALVLSLFPSQNLWAKEMASKSTVPDNSSSEIEYSIRPGDNFDKLRKKFDLAPGEIERANPGVEPRRLRPKQKIKIPKKNVSIQFRTGKPGVYKLRGGETFSGLAKRWGIPLSHLLEINGLTMEEASSLPAGTEILSFDMDRMIRAFISVETKGFPENKRDFAVGDQGKAVGCLQFWPETWNMVAKGKSRNSREDSVQAFRDLLERYSKTTDILTVEDILRKAKWNPKHSGREYIAAYLNDSGKGISLI